MYVCSSPGKSTGGGCADDVFSIPKDELERMDLNAEVERCLFATGSANQGNQKAA